MAPKIKWLLPLLIFFFVVALFKSSSNVNANHCFYTFSPTQVAKGGTVNVEISGAGTEFRIRIYRPLGLQQDVIYDNGSSPTTSRNAAITIPTDAEDANYTVEVQIPGGQLPHSCVATNTDKLAVGSAQPTGCSFTVSETNFDVTEEPKPITINITAPNSSLEYTARAGSKILGTATAQNGSAVINTEITQEMNGEYKILVSTFANLSTQQCSPLTGITINVNGLGDSAGKNPCSPTNCKTAIGNLPIGLKGLADKILQIAIGVAGGIALILIVVGAIRVLVSGGDPQKVNGGREMIIAAVSGLIFLIFTTVILEFLGVNVLGGVPGIN